MKKLILTIAIYMMFCNTAQVYADNYFVRTDGNDSCNGTVDTGGSSGNCAKRTIQAGVNLAVNPDDTVTVHAGDYSSSNPTFHSIANGSSGNPIIIKGASGETVTIARANISNNYNDVSGFRATNYGAWGNAGFYVTGTGDVIHNNTIVGRCRGDSGGCIGIDVRGNGNTISHNIFDGNNNNVNLSFVVAVYMEGSNAKVTYNTIQNFNSIERIFEIYGTGHVISNNEAKNGNWTAGGGVHPDIFQTFGTNQSQNIIIENNYFHDMASQVGNLEANGQSGNNSNVRDWVFRNNIFANVTLEFFNHVPRINWYNNTFYRVNTSNTGLLLYNGYEAGSGIVMNNAFIACGTASDNGWYTGSVTGDYNFVSNTATGGTKSGFSEAHGRNGGDPGMIALSNNCVTNTCDFHVGASSALVDVGSVISGFNTDKDGVSRPQGSDWDIGAYEFSSGGVALNPPQNLTVQ
jgi:hypothetical protein